MTEKDLMALAELIRAGKASGQEKIQFLQALSFELGEVSTILKKASAGK